MSLLNKGKPEAAKVSSASVGLLDEPKNDETNNNLPKEYLYSTPNADNYTIQLTDENVTAYRGVLTVSQAQHDEIQKLITKHKRFDISQNIVLLDPEAAERIAKAHMEAESKKRAAARGASSTMNHHALEDALVADRKPGDALRNLDVVEEDAIHADDSKLNPAGNNADIVLTQ